MTNTSDRLYVGCFDKNLRVWKTHIASTSTMMGHTNTVTGLCIAQNILYSCALDSTIRAWDIKVKSQLF